VHKPVETALADSLFAQSDTKEAVKKTCASFGRPVRLSASVGTEL